MINKQPQKELVLETNLDEAYLSIAKAIRNNKANLLTNLQLLAEMLARYTGASRASVWDLDDRTQRLQCQAVFSLEEERQLNCANHFIDLDTRPIFQAAIASTRVIDADDAINDPRAVEIKDPYLIPLNIQSFLCTTLNTLGKASGLIGLEVIGQTRQWKKEEEQFAIAAAGLAMQLITLDKLRLSKIQQKALYAESSSAILILRGYEIIDCNKAAVKLFGAQDKEHVIGKTPVDLAPEHQPSGEPTLSICKNIATDIYKTGKTTTFSLVHKRFDGSAIWCEVTISKAELNHESYLISQIKDITIDIELEKKSEQTNRELEHNKLHDPTTGLPNRNNLYNYTQRLIEHIKANSLDHIFTLLVFDLNRFKEINDTLGHDTGDILLKKIGLRLQNQLEIVGGKLYRLGGDEFAIVYAGGEAFGQNRRITNLISQSLKTPTLVGDIHWETTASIGLAHYPEHGTSGPQLLRCADVAMYASKTSGQPITIYDKSIDIHCTRRLTMMTALNNAIRSNQLNLHYQPRINISSGEITGCEALIRWHHPKLGTVPPNEFIPLAEASELIHAVTFWVIDTAMAQAKLWQTRGINIPIAVNISARNLSDPNLPLNILRLLGRHGLKTNMIEMEITESALMDHPIRAIENLKQINRMGIRLAIDDFGTGFSSLSYLKKMPIDALKVDQCFVKDLIKDANDRAIISSTVHLAHNFALQTVAEGVEDAETLKALKALGCDQAQGYHIAKPLPIQEFELWLASYLETPKKDSAKQIGR